jgi:hypothetical protein
MQPPSVLTCCALLCGAGLVSPLAAQIVRGEINTLRVAGPPPPVLVGPAMDLMLAGPNVRFQWQAGAGQTSPVRYEICVREPDRSCTDPTSVIYRPSGTLLTEGLLQQPMRPARPGEPGFGLPTAGAGAGVPTYFLSAALPPHLKGKRVEWSMSACVPDPRPVRFANAPAELCTSSSSRNVIWPLSLPTLVSPSPNSVLTTITDRFAWAVPDAQGIEYFLICLAARGTPCPLAPGVQPFVLTARVDQAPGLPLQFTPPPGSLATFMGEALQWSVAACNSTLGCSYQPARSGFRVPIIEGSWDSIYEVTQNAKCKNCHQMFAENETWRRHIDQGRFTREQVPPGAFSDHYVCNTCHTEATGFAIAWRSPPGDRSLDVARTDGRLCQALRVDQQAFLTGGSGAPHALGDPLIHWAVDRIPALGYEGWRQRFEKWTAARRPCCSNPGPQGCGSEPPHGQFTP